MKLLFLPPKPLLTKKGAVRKRARGSCPGRVFLEDGRELTDVATLSVSGGESQYADVTTTEDFQAGRTRSVKTVTSSTRLTLEFVNPQVEVISEAPRRVRVAARKAGAA